MSKPLIYLASPYSHKDNKVRQSRYEIAVLVTAKLLASEEVNVFSPIAHSHPLTLTNVTIRHDWDFWKEIDFQMIRKCDMLIALEMDGSDTSLGMQEEIAYAHELGIPVIHAPLESFLNGGNNA